MNVDQMLKERARKGPGWHALCPDCFWLIIPSGEDSYKALEADDDGVKRDGVR